MKRLGLLVAILIAVHLVLLWAGPSSVEPAHASETKRGPRVGIVFDVGGRGDKSFNDGAYNGADRARRELAAEVRFIEPGDGSDR